MKSKPPQHDMLADLDLTQRTRAALAGAGIMDLGTLMQRTEEDLRDIPRFGAKGVNEIRQLLWALGTGLRRGLRKLSLIKSRRLRVSGDQGRPAIHVVVRSISVPAI